MGYLVKEVANPKLTEEEYEELTIFITRSSIVSKPVIYLHLEGKGKKKMVKEEAEIEVQKKTREEERKEEMVEEEAKIEVQKKTREEERKKNYIFEAIIRKSHYF